MTVERERKEMKLKEYFDMREDILKRCLRNEEYFLNCLRDGKRMKRINTKMEHFTNSLLVAREGSENSILFCCFIF